MKTLYISDLDGTLLDNNVEVTSETAKIINSLIDKNMFFTVATARTHATVKNILSGLVINIPAVLMNGAAIYDFSAGKYVKINRVNQNGLEMLLDVIDKFVCSGFLYCINNEVLSTYYENTDSPNAVKFIREREKKYNKKFTKVNSFRNIESKNIVYYSVENKKEKLTEAYSILSKCSDLHTEFYRDIYETDHWYLEVCACESSKKNAVDFLRREYGFDRVVGFGDNLNDLPMFLACDEAYAVSNAKDEVKIKADGVILSNTENGVAKYLSDNFTK